MFINKNYKRDINYVFELNRFVFRLAGVWPYARTKPWFPDTLERTIVIFFSYVVLLCELVPGMFYMILIQKEFRTTLKVAAPVIFNMMSVIKYSQLLLSMNEVKNCLVQMEEDWKNVASSSDRDIMINKAKTGRRLLLICGIFMYTTGLSFRTIIPLSRGKTITAQNLTIRHLPCPAYFILFDVQLSPAYEVVFFIQFFTGFVKCTITTAVCGIAGLFVMHICAQLEILMTLMNNLVNNVELKNINKNFAIVVKYQIKMRNFLQLVENTIQYMSLVELVGSTTVVCLLGYFVILEWEVKNNTFALCSYIIGITSITFDMFLFCFIGEQLSVKGEEVALKACTLEWYCLPNANARALILIMAISNSPTVIKAGKFVDLSLKTFGNVTKTAAAYLNILKSVVE